MTINPEISWVQHARTPDVKTIHLQDVLGDIQGGQYKAEVEKIRNSLNSETNEAAELKKKLPGIMFSGLFSKRNAKGLKANSGSDFHDLPRLREIPLLPDCQWYPPFKTTLHLFIFFHSFIFP